MRRLRGLGIQRARGIRLELALVPLLADGEIEGAGQDQDGTNRIGMPMGHDLHPRQKLDAVDVQTGPRRVAEKRDVLRRSGGSLVGNVPWQLDDAGAGILSVSGPACSRRAKSEQQAGRARIHGCLLSTKTSERESRARGL